MKALFEENPEGEQFLARSEIAELTAIPRPILLEAIDKRRLLTGILEEARLLQANPDRRERPRMKPVSGSNELGYTSVERPSYPRNASGVRQPPG